MKLLGFSVIDEKVGAYANPFFAPTVALAIRMFLDWCVDPEASISKHPGDYRLYQVGGFDQETGLFDQASPRLVASGSESVQPGPSERTRFMEAAQ